MNSNRLEAFSDGVLAIIITIMVLELKVPEGTDLQSLKSVLPVFSSYVLSFIYVGIYWNNHHHMMYTVEKVSGGILWANLHLLFWLSLIPFVTGWMGENHFAKLPMAMYGGVLLMAAIAYFILQKSILAVQGKDSLLAKSLGKDLKGKASPLFYIIAISMSFFNTWIAGAIYVLVAFMWLIPDKRIELIFKEKQ
ncbi:TMEM175 family protein [Aequorivita capsosiphonis]|uniref:TMEM175 family protein n=1 Tax=Aequorivita capsosiphonis TaxID=487317 RepID=UPI000407B865|nr:TMEM175 family protein [Aequorivita capsosiphonis]